LQFFTSHFRRVVGELKRIGKSFSFELATPRRRTYAACFGTLCSAEKQRAQRLAFEHHRRQLIFARGLRLALSSSAPQVKPSEWSFVANHYGRPCVAAPAIAQTLYFSLSHTEGCVACVASGCETVGFDVEKIHARSLFGSSTTAR
jgi:4'-phosphopantetheinyl transferase